MDNLGGIIAVPNGVWFTAETRIGFWDVREKVPKIQATAPGDITSFSYFSPTRYCNATPIFLTGGDQTFHTWDNRNMATPLSTFTHPDLKGVVSSFGKK